MATKKKTKNSPILKIIVVVLIVAIIAIFIPRLVHKCDHCGKVFFGTGYEPNVISDLVGGKDQVICKDCAEQEHALEFLIGKSLKDFKRPLF